MSTQTELLAEHKLYLERSEVRALIVQDDHRTLLSAVDALPIFNAEDIRGPAQGRQEPDANVEADSIYPDPFASVYSEEESDANGYAAGQREAFVCGAEWARSVAAQCAPQPSGEPAGLQVWYGPMPESNGKSNFTAILHKGDLVEGHTIARSEYPERVRYEADRVRYLIGDLSEAPFVLDYDADKHSGYTPSAPRAVSCAAREALEQIMQFSDCHYACNVARNALVAAGGEASKREGNPVGFMEAHATAMVAVQAFYDAASYEETLWTGYGEQIVPPYAEMRRIKAGQAVAALRDAQPSSLRKDG
jgi:hypothetical protein